MKTKPLQALVLSGGPGGHSYEQMSRQLAAILEQVGIHSRVTEDLNVLGSSELEDFDLVVLNCAWFTCRQNPPWQAVWGRTLSGASRAGLLKHLGKARGLLALHAATICFDDWPEFPKILGAYWEWGLPRSSHSPYQTHLVKVRPAAHPIVEGLSDFSIMDEIYTYPKIVDPIDPFITAEWESVVHPLLWVRTYGEARVCYCALGHGPETFENKTFQTLLRRAALWVAKKLENEDAR